MKKLFKRSLIFCTLALLLCGTPIKGMYRDLTREECLNEMLEYIDGHNVLLEEEDRTPFDSIEAIKLEMKRREENWGELMGQEWGTMTLHNVDFFSDTNLTSSFSFAHAIVLTPFRAGLGFLAQGRSELGENQLNRWWGYWKDMAAKENVMNRFYLNFIVRLYNYYDSVYVLLKYGNKELKPVFSEERESTIDYEGQVRFEDPTRLYPKEREEWKQLELYTPGWGPSSNPIRLIPFFYFSFLIDDPNFDPQGLIELSMSISKDDIEEEAVFVIDLSKMR